MAKTSKMLNLPKDFESTIIYDSEQLDLLIRETGKNIKNERLKRGMSIVELSMLANIDPAHLYRIECGRSKVGLEGLLKIVVAFDMPIDKIIPIAFEPKHHTASEKFREIVKPLDQKALNCLLYFLDDWVRWEMNRQNQKNNEES